MSVKPRRQGFWPVYTARDAKIAAEVAEWRAEAQRKRKELKAKVARWEAICKEAGPEGTVQAETLARFKAELAKWC